MPRSCCLILGARSGRGRRRRREPARHVVRRDEGSQAHLLRSARLPRAARGAHVHQLARVAAPDVRLGAVRAHDGPAEGLRRLRQRRASLRAAQQARLRRRAAVPRVRDVPGERAHVLADEPRDWSTSRRATWRPRRTGAGAASSSARSRRSAQNPESLLYSYLTVPRFTAPRWCLEGSAVFMETWMGGGLGRAQGGYDEMVFRAMVRDDAHFYDPLGLVSRGDPRRLPGRRERLPLRHALLHLARVRPLAGEGRSPGSGATRAASATTPTSSSTCSACRSSRPGRSGSRSSASSSGATSRRCASTRSRRSGSSSASAVGLDLAHVLRRGDRHPLRRLPLPGRGRARRRAEHARRQRAATRRHQAARCSTGSRRSPTTRRAARPSTPTTTSRLRDLMAVDVKTGEERMLLEDARIGEIVVQPGRPLAAGRAPRERPRDAGAHPVSVHGVDDVHDVSVRSRALPTSTSRPTGGCCRRR